jgi:hypothetical protein
MRNEPIYIVSTEETYHYGQVIYEEGSSGDWVYLILSGLVEVSKKIQDKKVIIEIMQSGDTFGVVEYITRTKRSTTVRSIGMTTLGLIDREFLDREYNQLSAQLRGVLETMARKCWKVTTDYSRLVFRNEPQDRKVLPLLFSDGQNSFRGHTVNVHAKGLFVVTEHLLPEGQEFLLRLQLPGVTEPLKIIGQVVRTQERDKDQLTGTGGMEVKFKQISKTDYTLLKDFLSPKDMKG